MRKKASLKGLFVGKKRNVQIMVNNSIRRAERSAAKARSAEGGAARRKARRDDRSERACRDDRSALAEWARSDERWLQYLHVFATIIFVNELQPGQRRPTCTLLIR